MVPANEALPCRILVPRNALEGEGWEWLVMRFYTYRTTRVSLKVWDKHATLMERVCDRLCDYTFSVWLKPTVTRRTA